MKTFWKLMSITICILLEVTVIKCGISVVIANSLKYTADSLPEYTSVPYVEINENIPEFTEGDYVTEAFETYSELDELGRCGPAFALVCCDTMPQEERGNISSVTPTGWVQNKYETTLVSGGYIYNRCHLIGWQLTGENANNKNLITGTRYMNIEGMLGFENSVSDYVKEYKGHVLYRVTPVFENDNLLASGVLMEAFSVDDSGYSISFFVYCFNVQPGIAIDYATGENSIIVIVPEDTKRYIYILNTKSKKYHTPECRYASSIAIENRQIVCGNICCPENDGYTPCSVCNANVSSHLLGDVDSDNLITVFDSRIVLRYALEFDFLDADFITYCDYNSDLSVSVEDARGILRSAVGLE